MEVPAGLGADWRGRIVAAIDVLARAAKGGNRLLKIILTPLIFPFYDQRSRNRKNIIHAHECIVRIGLWINAIPETHLKPDRQRKMWPVLHQCRRPRCQKLFPSLLQFFLLPLSPDAVCRQHPRHCTFTANVPRPGRRFETISLTCEILDDSLVIARSTECAALIIRPFGVVDFLWMGLEVPMKLLRGHPVTFCIVLVVQEPPADGHAHPPLGFHPGVKRDNCRGTSHIDFPVHRFENFRLHFVGCRRQYLEFNLRWPGRTQFGEKRRDSEPKKSGRQVKQTMKYTTDSRHYVPQAVYSKLWIQQLHFTELALPTK